MDWQQKAAALDALHKIELHIRKPGDWYVHHGVEIGGDGLLIGSYGNGATPEEAVEDHWRKLCDELPVGRYIVVNAMNNRRRHVRWNGYMWCDLEVVTEAAK